MCILSSRLMGCRLHRPPQSSRPTPASCGWQIPLQTSPGLSTPQEPPASLPLFTYWVFLLLGMCGRRTGPPWAWRATPASAWTKTAPCTSRRRGQGTLARTPAECSQLEATIRAVLTFVSGKGRLPRPRAKEG